MMKQPLLILILASLVACGDKEAPPAESGGEPTPAAEAISRPGPTAEPVPAPATAPPAPMTPPAATAASSEPSATPSPYTVVKGDTLYGIARRHNLDYRELAEWNGIRNPGQIRPGQKLSLSPSSR